MEYKYLADDFKFKKKMYDGVTKVADMIGKTLGPKGKSVVIQSSTGTSLITNDGATIAKNVKLLDSCEDIGAQLIAQVASNADKVGDGTTTATILASSILQNLLLNQEQYSNVNNVREGMNKAIECIEDSLKSFSVNVSSKDDVINIATISCKDEELGKIIGTAAYEVGKDGVIDISKGHMKNTTKEIIKGVKIKSGYLSSYFASSNGVCTLGGAGVLVLIVKDDIISDDQIIPVLNYCVQHKANLLVFCRNISESPLSIMIKNKLAGIVNSCVITNPYTDKEADALFEDLALITGGKVIGEGEAIESIEYNVDENGNVQLYDNSIFGTCTKVDVFSDKTNIIGLPESSDELKDKVKTLTDKLEDVSDYEKKNLRKRISFLNGRSASIKVGGNSKVEIDDKFLRVQDAVYSSLEALKGGIVPGEGKALLNVFNIYKNDKDVYTKYNVTDTDTKDGFNSVIEACVVPFIKILSNCGYTDKFIKHKTDLYSDLKDTKNYNLGIDINTDKDIDLLEEGVIDSYNTVISSVVNAVSVIGTLITVDGLVLNAKDLLKEDIN